MRGGFTLAPKMLTSGITLHFLAIITSFTEIHCDFRKKEDVEALFKREKPTHVIHLAAAVGGLFMNMRRKVSSYTSLISS